ncbi:hypothetical protein ACFL54_06530, partial [Planctomycetota bacterium]
MQRLHRILLITVLLVLASVLLLSAENDQNNDNQAKGVILYVNDAPVLKSELDRDVEYLLENRKIPRVLIVYQALSEQMLLAMLRQENAERYKMMEENALAAMKRLDGGESFSKVCKEISE